MKMQTLWLTDISLEPGSWADWFSGTMSALAVVIAVGSYGFSEYRSRREREQQDMAVARRMGVKLLRLINESNGILKQVRPSTSPPDVEMLKFTHRDVHPLGGLDLTSDLSVDHDEADLALSTGDAEFLSELLLAFDRHRSVYAGLIEYKAKYEALQALHPTPVAMDGQVFTYEWTQGEYLKLAPQIVMIDALLNSVISLARENVVKVDRLSENYTRLMRIRFKREKWIRFETVEPDAS